MIPRVHTNKYFIFLLIEMGQLMNLFIPVFW